jgi:hypothetical protein
VRRLLAFDEPFLVVNGNALTTLDLRQSGTRT